SPVLTRSTMSPLTGNWSNCAVSPVAYFQLSPSRSNSGRAWKLSARPSVCAVPTFGSCSTASPRWVTMAGASKLALRSAKDMGLLGVLHRADQAFNARAQEVPRIDQPQREPSPQAGLQASRVVAEHSLHSSA